MMMHMLSKVFLHKLNFTYYNIEKTFEIDDDPTIDQDLNENLTLDSLRLSDDEDFKLTSDFNKLKYSVENTKRNNKIEKGDLEKKKLIEFSPKIIKREEVVEDFIRNFFVQFKLTNTLEEFNVNTLVLINFKERV